MNDTWYSFGREELEKMSMADLKLLATYYGVEHVHMKKKELIEKLSPTVNTFGVPKYSARILRIMEQNKIREQEQI